MEVLTDSIRVIEECLRHVTDGNVRSDGVTKDLPVHLRTAILSEIATLHKLLGNSTNVVALLEYPQFWIFIGILLRGHSADEEMILCVLKLLKRLMHTFWSLPATLYPPQADWFQSSEATPIREGLLRSICDILSATPAATADRQMQPATVAIAQRRKQIEVLHVIALFAGAFQACKSYFLESLQLDQSILLIISYTKQLHSHQNGNHHVSHDGHTSVYLTASKNYGYACVDESLGTKDGLLMAGCRALWNLYSDSTFLLSGSSANQVPRSSSSSVNTILAFLLSAIQQLYSLQQAHTSSSATHTCELEDLLWGTVYACYLSLNEGHQKQLVACSDLKELIVNALEESTSFNQSTAVSSGVADVEWIYLADKKASAATHVLKVASQVYALYKYAPLDCIQCFNGTGTSEKVLIREDALSPSAEDTHVDIDMCNALLEFLRLLGQKPIKEDRLGLGQIENLVMCLHATSNIMVKIAAQHQQPLVLRDADIEARTRSRSNSSNMSADEAALLNTISRSGACEICIGMLVLHIPDQVTTSARDLRSQLILATLHVVASLSFFLPMLTVNLIRAGVCKAVVDIVKVYPDHVDIVECALRIFWNLSFQEENRFLLAGVGSVETLLSLIPRFTVNLSSYSSQSPTGNPSKHVIVVLLIVQYFYKLVDVSVSKRLDRFVSASSGRSDSFDASKESGWDTFRRQLRYLEAKSVLTKYILDKGHDTFTDEDRVIYDWIKQTCKSVMTVL
jgi:hypothetical protein